MKDQEFIETTISRQELFKGKIIDLVVDQVRLPSGESSTRELIFHSGAVALLALTNEEEIILVKQYRKPLEQVMLEIPAGKIDETDSHHRETAKRELEEETGYQAEVLDFLMSFATSPGFANEVIHLYRAEGLIKVENPLPQDEDELIELCYFDLPTAKELIKTGKITDAKTILAIQYWELNQ